MRRLVLLAVLCLGAAHPAAAEMEALTARGQEPSWQVSIDGEAISFIAPGLGIKQKAAPVTREMVDGHPRLSAGTGDGRITVTVIERLCADTMTGMPFPVSVRVERGGRSFTGCGGETMAVIGGGWRVIRIGGTMLPAGVTATIEFGTDGRVSGKSGCNRFTGTYTLTGEGLAFGPLALTRMACPPPRMQAERRFADAMARVTRVTPGENAQLRLMAGDDEVMVLDRAD